jgi:hypothetical protein
MVVLLITTALAAPVTLDVERAAVADLDAIYIDGRDWVWVQGARKTVRIEHWQGGRSPYLDGVTVVNLSRDGTTRRIDYFAGPDRRSARLVRAGVSFRTSYRGGRDSYSRRETEPLDGPAPLSLWTLLAALPQAAASPGSSWTGALLEDNDIYEAGLKWTEHGDGTWVHLEADPHSGWLVEDGRVTAFTLGRTQHRLADADQREQCLELMATLK